MTLAPPHPPTAAAGPWLLCHALSRSPASHGESEDVDFEFLIGS